MPLEQENAAAPDTDQKHGHAGAVNDDDAAIDDYVKTAEKHRQKVKDAARMALVIGILLISLAQILKEWIPEKSIFSILLAIIKDLGIGFIVGAAVGLLWEAGARAGPQAQADMQLKSAIAKLQKAQERFERAEAQFAEQADPELGIRKRLKKLLPDPKYDDFNDNIIRLIKEMVGIKALDDAAVKKTEMTAQYVGFVNWMLAEFALRGTRQTAKLLSGFGDDPVAEANYSSQERRTVTLQLMSAQMKSMGNNDRYDSVTSVWLYQNAPEEYITATRTALRNGFKIRRIFNLCSQRRGNYSEVRQLIERQAQQLAFEDHFQYRYLTCSALDQLKLDVLKAARIDDPNKVKTLYFGHFYHVDAERISRFTAGPSDLSQIHVAVFPANHSNDEPDCYVRLFEHLWECSADDPPWDNAAPANHSGTVTRRRQR